MRPLGLVFAHDWSVDQITDLFRTTHRVKTQQVVKSHGQHCGDIELPGYLANAADPVPLVLDLRLTHDRFDSSSDPTLDGRLHYNDVDKSLNEDANDKIRKYRADYNNNPTNSFRSSVNAIQLGIYVLSLSPRGCTESA